MTTGRHPHCIRWNSAICQSPTWTAFEQVAHVKTGEPFICCKQCLKHLKHPTTNNSGMTALKKHTESSACRRKRKPGSQPLLDAMLKVVSSTQPPGSGEIIDSMLICISETIERQRRQLHQTIYTASLGRAIGPIAGFNQRVLSIG